MSAKQYHTVKLVKPSHGGAPKGAFAVYKGEEPAVTGNIRLRLSTVDNGTPLVAHLSAMVVKHGDLVMGKRWEDINILW